MTDMPTPATGALLVLLALAVLVIVAIAAAHIAKRDLELQLETVDAALDDAEKRAGNWHRRYMRECSAHSWTLVALDRARGERDSMRAELDKARAAARDALAIVTALECDAVERETRAW